MQQCCQPPDPSSFSRPQHMGPRGADLHAPGLLREVPPQLSAPARTSIVPPSIASVACVAGPPLQAPSAPSALRCVSVHMHACRLRGWGHTQLECGHGGRGGLLEGACRQACSPAVGPPQSPGGFSLLRSQSVAAPAWVLAAPCRAVAHVSASRDERIMLSELARDRAMGLLHMSCHPG